MVQLKLTKRHTVKLLKMCKILFPEHTIFEIDQDGYILSFSKKCPAIHWFEFCMLHLAPKIIYPLYIPAYCDSEEGGQIGMEKFGNAILYNKAHPVDYLYEQFKELK